MKWIWLGETEYWRALEIQARCFEITQKTGIEFILGCSHPSVITVGRSSTDESLFDLQNNFSDIPVVRTDRGGAATFHNPGQLVIYPILNLRAREWGVRYYVDFLLGVTSEYLRSENILAFVPPKVKGVFTVRGKIASVGIRVREGISSHGLALNVCNDLQTFSAFSACGVSGQIFDSMRDWGKSNLPESVFSQWKSIWLQDQEQDQGIVLDASQDLKYFDHFGDLSSVGRVLA